MEDVFGAEERARIRVDPVSKHELETATENEYHKDEHNVKW